MDAPSPPASASPALLDPWWRPVVCALALAAIFATAASLGIRKLASRITLNLTASMPRGLYWLRPAQPISRGTVVVFEVPSRAHSLLAPGRHLPQTFRLLKRVVALAGDHVCTDGNRYVVGEELISTIAVHDRHGRPLEPYRFCGVVSPGAAFVAAHDESSLDSRYFGPLAITDLTPAVPLWTSLSP